MRNLVRLCCALAAAAFVTAASSPAAFHTSARARAFAGTINVNSTSDAASNDGLCTLREAITSANNDAASGAAAGECAAGLGTDTINVPVTGTINLTGVLPDIASNLSIVGPGSGQLTVRRNTGGDYRIFLVESGSTASISGLTVTNGKTPDEGVATGSGAAGGGGVVNAAGATLSMTDVVVTGNRTGAGGDDSYPGGHGGQGGRGGGILNVGTMTLTNCRVTGNSTGAGGFGEGAGGDGGDGGGIVNWNDKLTIIGGSVSSNTTGAGGTALNGGGAAGNGGGIYNVLGDIDMTGVVISDNTTGSNGGTGSGNGGGLYLMEGHVTLTNSTVSGNIAGPNTNAAFGNGGAFDSGAVLTVLGSTISGNKAGSGSAIVNRLSLSMTNSTVSGNRLRVLGGNNGAINSNAALTLTNCTLADNDTFALVASGPSPVVGNTIFEGKNGGTLPVVSGSFTSKGHNLVGNADGSTGFNAAGDQVGSTASPLFPQLGVLADYGGPTKTHALGAYSPAIDAGDNALAKDASNNALATDQRGFARFADGPDADTTQTVDIGAYEANPTVENIADRQMEEDSTLSFNFNLGDAALGITSVIADSANPSLVPNDPAHISVSGTGSQRTLNITPAAGANGVAGIRVTVIAANGLMAMDTFQLTVLENDAVVSAVSGTGPYSGTATLTATLKAPNGSALAGRTINFTLGGTTGTGTTNASGVATFSGATLQGLTPGTYPNIVGASFAGDASYGGSSATGPLNVVKADTTTTVTVANATYDGNPHGATANVTGPGGLNQGVTVSYSGRNGTTYGPSNTAPTNAGDYTASASYAGDSNYNASSDSKNFSIAKAGTSTALTSSKNPSAVGQSVTFTATVTSAAGTPTGAVQFKVDGANAGGPVALSSGVATFTTSGLSAGLHAVTAGYGGDANFSASAGTLAGAQRVGSSFEFGQSSYGVAEGASVTVTVVRSGDTTQAVSVDYATDDGSTPSAVVPCSSVTGLALDRCDYTKALGTLRFAAGETSKTFVVLAGDDSYTEGPETARVRLSNPSAGSALVDTPSAVFTITDDSPESAGNTIDDTDDFVHQHYLDFLNREPDAPGLAFWKNSIESCGADAQCREVKRINASAAFFLSIEFQETGYLVERAYKVAYGDATSPGVAGTVPVVRLDEFLPDTQRIGQGVIVGQGAWQTQLDANKVAYFEEFVSRARFASAFPTTLSPAAFVDALFANAGVAPAAAQRQAAVDEFAGASNTSNQQARAKALRLAAENPSLNQQEKARAYVLMQYFGYLRRNPDDAPQPGLNHSGWRFWLDKLNSFDGDAIRAEMVKAFLAADEYRHRFGQ